MCRQSPLWGWGGVYTCFALGFVCLILSPPYFFSYLVLVLSPSRLQTHMSCNSSLESHAFVKRASTENRLLWLRKPIKKSQGSKLKKCLGQLLATNWRNIVARCSLIVWRDPSDLQISWIEVGINLEVNWLCLCDLAHFLWWKQSKIRWNVCFDFTLLI